MQDVEAPKTKRQKVDGPEKVEDAALHSRKQIQLAEEEEDEDCDSIALLAIHATSRLHSKKEEELSFSGNNALFVHLFISTTPQTPVH